ncbi:MAG: helix-turn-helix transcriptional regulator [Candidatus Aminicenantes bacterium]|nr:helix-turn-helix transcriptional regulator [Candidatus Aminicenantes bacterium]
MSEKYPNFYVDSDDESRDSLEMGANWLQGWDDAKKAMNCPGPREARRTLRLTVKQFAQLLEISERTVYRLEEGYRELGISERILINKAIEICRKRGFIEGRPDTT